MGVQDDGFHDAPRLIITQPTIRATNSSRLFLFAEKIRRSSDLTAAAFSRRVRGKRPIDASRSAATPSKKAQATARRGRSGRSDGSLGA